MFEVKLKSSLKFMNSGFLKIVVLTKIFRKLGFVLYIQDV